MKDTFYVYRKGRRTPETFEGVRFVALDEDSLRINHPAGEWVVLKSHVSWAGFGPVRFDPRYDRGRGRKTLEKTLGRRLKEAGFDEDRRRSPFWRRALVGALVWVRDSAHALINKL